MYLVISVAPVKEGGTHCTVRDVSVVVTNVGAKRPFAIEIGITYALTLLSDCPPMTLKAVMV